MTEERATELRPEVTSWLDEVSDVEIDDAFSQMTSSAPDAGEPGSSGSVRVVTLLVSAVVIALVLWTGVAVRDHLVRVQRQSVDATQFSASRVVHRARDAAAQRGMRAAQAGAEAAMFDGLARAEAHGRETLDDLVLAPVPNGALDALDDVDFDPPPEDITQGIHYVVSNEWKHFLFEPFIKGLGGVFVGVGTDQLYVMAGWAKPQVLIPMDFDQYIVDLHHVYGAFFRHADTPKEFLALWESNNVEYAHRIIRKYYPHMGPRYIRRYDGSRRKVRERLNGVREYYAYWGESSFLSDSDQYRYVAELWRKGRVHPVRGDLTGYETMNDLGRWARRFDLPIREFYTSNAQYYFSFDTENFRENIAALYFDDTSVALHTDPYTDDDYEYFVQNGKNYQAWVARKRVVGLRHILYYADHDPASDLVTISRTPKDVWGH